MDIVEKASLQPSESSAGRAGISLVDPWATPMKGEVEVIRWLGKVGSGKIVERWRDRNLVVTLARRIMSRLVSGASPDVTPAVPVIHTETRGDFTITNPNQLYITKMKWGIGGHNPLSPTTPVDPVPTDEALYTPLPVAPAFKLVTVDYPAINSVRFTASLEQSEANGQPISEVGLFTNEHDLLFARKTFGILTKSAEFEFEFRWTLIF